MFIMGLTLTTANDGPLRLSIVRLKPAPLEPETTQDQIATDASGGCSGSSENDAFQSALLKTRSDNLLTRR